MSEVVVWTDLLHIDTVTGATEDQTGFHCLGESFGLLVSWSVGILGMMLEVV